MKKLSKLNSIRENYATSLNTSRALKKISLLKRFRCTNDDIQLDKCFIAMFSTAVITMRIQKYFDLAMPRIKMGKIRHGNFLWKRN